MAKRNIVAAALLPLILALGAQAESAVRVMFDPTSPEVGPFPTDALTIPDSAQKTGVRVNLPQPDCQAEPSTCEEIAMVNQLDGFNIEPRLRVRFSGPINPDTLREGIFLVWLDDLTDEESGLQPFGHVAPINSVSYDPATNTAFAEPDEILSQHRRYALVVTNAVRDTDGEPVVPDPAFLACIGRRDGYCEQLADALPRVSMQFAHPRLVVGGSVFTTMSVTAWLEKARAALHNSPVNFQRAQPKSVFAVSSLSAVVLEAQTGVAPPTFTNMPLPILPQLTGVDRIAFGSFWSPSFLDENQVIPTVPTGDAVGLPAKSREIFFHVYLPAKPKPDDGYPAVIVGHGANQDRFSTATNVTAALADKGFAVVAVNAVGAGYGPETKLALRDTYGETVHIAAGGLAADVNGDGNNAAGEGCALLGPSNAVGYRDCSRQSALDIMQLVRAIRAGIDLDGDGVVDLDGGNIYYAGGSQGAVFGSILIAVETDIKAAVLTSGVGSVADASRWAHTGTITRNAMIATMKLRNPPLFNKPSQEYDFDWPLRDRPVRIISVPGAIALQEYLERLQWRTMPGEPLGYAARLRPSASPGMSGRRVLFQFGIGDATFPNPCQSSFVRAADLRETTSLYRHDLAWAVAPYLNPNAHAMWNLGSTEVGQRVSGAAKQQMARFLKSDVAVVPDVNDLVRQFFGRDLFEVPQFLPEELNYLQ